MNHYNTLDVDVSTCTNHIYPYLYLVMRDALWVFVVAAPWPAGDGNVCDHRPFETRIPSSK